MRSILEFCTNGKLKGLVMPRLIIATRPGIGAIEKALRAGMPEEDVIVLNPKDFSSREQWGAQLIEESECRNINFMGLYGCLTKIPEKVIDYFGGNAINQHPALAILTRENPILLWKFQYYRPTDPNIRILCKKEHFLSNMSVR